jgi:uncharacterized protein
MVDRDDDQSGEKPQARSRPCPVCGKPARQRFRPFCSARCQTIDLARWIGGNYRVPDGDEDDLPNVGDRTE